jgi:hypothetical protein
MAMQTRSNSRHGVHQPKAPPLNGASVFSAHLAKPCSAHALASSQGYAHARLITDTMPAGHGKAGMQ